MIELRCSFCGLNQRVIEQLVAGPSVYLCNRCAAELDSSKPLPACWVDERRMSLRCSFCNRLRSDTTSMFSRSGCALCGQCLEAAQWLFTEYRPPPPSRRQRVVLSIAGALKRIKDLMLPWSLSKKAEEESSPTSPKRALFKFRVKPQGLVERGATAALRSARSSGMR